MTCFDAFTDSVGPRKRVRKCRPGTLGVGLEAGSGLRGGDLGSDIAGQVLDEREIQQPFHRRTG